MKHYEDFTLEDFVQDLYFRKWVLGSLNQNDSFWENWCKENIEKQEIIEQARSIIIGLQYFPEEENQEEIDSAIQQILKQRDKDHLKSIKRYPIRNIAAVFIAVVLMGIGLGKILPIATDNTHLSEYKSSDKIHWITNESDSTRSFMLPDSSSIILNPLSRIGIMPDFNKNDRSLQLIGEALFNVQPNSEKPFYVFSENIVTKVLGTSFIIRSYEKERNVSVSVISGKVTVRKNSTTVSEEQQEIILVPNQQAVISKTDEKIIRKLIPAPVVVAEPEKLNHLHFNNTPITEVFLNLETAYGIPISYDPNLFKNCNLTARFSNEDFFQKLDLICETLQADYSVVDGQILIIGNGCN